MREGGRGKGGREGKERGRRGGKETIGLVLPGGVQVPRHLSYC